MQRSQTKRQFLQQASAVGLVGALQAACAPGGSGNTAGEAGQRREVTPAKISYLRYYNQPDRVAAEQTIFKRLEQQNPGLSIEELTVASTTEMIQQMTASYVAGTAPDTWTTAPTIYHEYVKSGNLLQLDDRIKKDIDPKKHFMETMSEWESPAASGKHFGLTRDFVVTILYYNKNMFDTASVPYPDATWTYDTMLRHAPKFAKQQDSGENSEWAFLATAGHDNFDAVARANGGRVVNKQRTRVVMDSTPETAATLDQWVAVNQQLRISPPPSHPFWQSYQGLSLRNPFFTGRVAMHQALTGLISQLRSQNNSLLQWAVAPVPKGKVKHDAYGGPDGQVISKSSKHPDAAWLVMRAFLTPESLPFHLAWGGIPFSREITALPEWRDQEPKGHTKVLLDSATFFAANFNIDWSKWQATKREAVNAALDGKLGTREALRQATEESNKILVDAYPQP